MKKTPAIIISTLLSGSLLTACSTSKELERIPFCKSIVENIVGKSLAWSSAEENDAGIALEVAVTSEEHIASCIYESIDSNEGQMVDSEQYESSPTTVIIDGNEVPALDLIKASAAATGKAAKKAVKEVSDEAGKAAEKAKEAAGKAGEAAKEITNKALDAAKDKLSQ